MGREHRPLLCELHAHSTWSDGELTVRQLVDLYGSAGFDVLAVTDHVVRPDDPWGRAAALRPDCYRAYLEQIDQEAERARACYDLLVVPGLELTFDDPDPRLGAHALAVGLRKLVELDVGLEPALRRARACGAALVASHPYTLAGVGAASRTTARFAEQPEWARMVVDRFELCNRYDFFDWVARAQLPVVANGDFHRREHLASWKTLVPVEKSEEAVVEYLRSGRPVSLTLVEAHHARARRAA
jgi:predicted metal-dependent phosphoesterase TrpH